jgi:protein gp37
MTAIEWTDETWNPTDGCKVCSPGCANCYAMRFAGRFSKPGERYHGLVAIGKNKRAIWTGESRLDAGKLAKPLSWRKPRRIFVNSMSDLFYEGFSNEQIAAVFGVMAACPQHTFQVLTKRAKRMREWFSWLENSNESDAEEWSGRDCSVSIDDARRDCVLGYIDDAGMSGLAGHFDGCHLGLMTSPARQWPLPNVWLGVSVENQAAADERIPELLRTPAEVRFLSCEPLIGEVDLDLPRCDNPHHGPSEWVLADDDATPWCIECDEERSYGHWLHLDGGIDWVIGGCESGPGARSGDVSWFRQLRDQCAEVDVPFFLKQAAQAFSGQAMAAGVGSKRKPGGIIGLPYLDGVQHAGIPSPRSSK